MDRVQTLKNKVRRAMEAVVERNAMMPPTIKEASAGFGYIWELEMEKPFPNALAQVSLVSTDDDKIHLVTAGLTMKDKSLRLKNLYDMAIGICDLAFRMGPAIPQLGVTLGGMFEMRYRFIPYDLTQEQLEYQMEAGLWSAVHQYGAVIAMLAEVASMTDVMNEFAKFLRQKRMGGTEQQEASPESDKALMDLLMGRGPGPDRGPGFGSPNVG